MLLKPLTLAVAGLAATAQAFLIPPQVSDSDIKAVESSPKVFANPSSKSLNLTCPGCPLMVSAKHGSVKVKTNKASHLELLFSIHSGLNYDKFMLGSFELYPSLDPIHGVLRAPLVPDDVEREPRRKHHRLQLIQEPKLGFGLQVQPVAKNSDGVELISLDLQIVEVGTTFIYGIPSVHILLLKDSAGSLAIGSIEATESQTPASTPMDTQAECATWLCKWMAHLKGKISQMKGKHCGGKKGGGDSSRPKHHEHPHGDRPEKLEHHGHHRSWGQLFKNIAAHILLPVAIGIVAGVSVSLIGMMVGTLIISIWRVFFRRSCARHTHCPIQFRTHSHHKSSKHEADVAEEKSGLMDHQDPPPTYEEEAVKTDI